jgi:hypothetical protein
MNNAVLFGLAGCVDYTFPTDSDTHHQAGSFSMLVVARFTFQLIKAETGIVIVKGVSLIASDLTLDPGAD